jgi:hypothetical protein
MTYERACPGVLVNGNHSAGIHR